MPDGVLRFARYAFPPNERGLCGPDQSDLLAEAIRTSNPDPEVAAIAARFEGAWPYLELLGSAIASGRPLDHRSVDAYWLADPVGRRTRVSDLGDSLRARFATRAGWPGLRDSISEGGWPTHAYHVFLVYPWIGLMRSGLVEPGLEVIDRCRIRWGRVLEVSGAVAVVESDRLTWDGSAVVAGPPLVECVSLLDGQDGVEPGKLVSLHWDWLCEPITERQRSWLETAQRHHLALANHTGALHSVS